MPLAKYSYLNILFKAAETGLFIVFILLLSHSEAIAQSSDKRPTIGLVLSGGGSHGIAHLGVLKVMEEAGLRPDYITGVSMGSIIGAMYSIGYSSDSLQKLLNTVNWEVALSNKIPENKIIFLEKKHFYNSLMSLPVSLKKVTLPSGLINGQMIENALSFYAWPTADINDFSKLPIPFMCVATDILTFKKADLKTGYLPDAIRASIAIPSILTPIKIDTALLLDGGMVRNFAASEAIDMGADIIIGSYVGFHRYNEEELQSLPGIIKQFGFSRSIEDFEEQKKLVNLLIIPDLSSISSSDFSNPDTIIQRGYKAALPYKNYFIKLADSLNKFGAQKPIENILDKQFYKFDKIEIIGNKLNSDAQIMGVLDIKPGDKTDKYMISDRIELLYGKAWFEKVKYRVLPRNDSLILVIDCIEKPKAMLYGSAHYDNSLLSGVLLSFSFKNLLTRRSVIDVDSYLSQYFRFRVNMIQFIDRSQKFGLSANFYADNTLIPILQIQNENMGVISRNFSPGITISKRLGLNYMMSLSSNFENLYLKPHFPNDENLKYLAYNYLTNTFDYQVNTLNTKNFPDKGTILNISTGTSKLLSGIIKTDSSKTIYEESDPGNFAFSRFFTFYGNFKQYFSRGDRFTYAISGDVLFITDSYDITEQNNFFLLGGFESLNKRSVPMIGFHANEIPVKKLAGVGTEVDMELSDNFHLNFSTNIFAAQEADRHSGYSILAGYGLGVGYMSLAGPLRAGLMHGIYNREKFFRGIKGYISLGYKF